MKEVKQKNRIKVTQEKGITLIALVITVIILIILATVTLNVVLGEGGLIARAQQAKELTEQAVIEEQQGLNSLVSEYANIMDEDQSPSEPTIFPERWDSSKVTAEKSTDGVIVPVPIGYTASRATGENSVNDGFVIYEGKDEVNDTNVVKAKTSRNQFVWIPVSDINQMAKTAQNGGIDNNGRINYQGKLYDFTSTRCH